MKFEKKQNNNKVQIRFIVNVLKSMRDKKQEYKKDGLNAQIAFCDYSIDL